jgi:hypothetical protein
MNEELTMIYQIRWIVFRLTTYLFLVMSAYSCAQSTGTSGPQSNTIQTPSPFDPSMNTTNPSATAAQSQNPYLGSVPTDPLVPGVLPLSLDDAVRHALKANLGLIDSQQMTAEMRAERLKALSALLPHLSAEASEVFQTMNYDTIGAEKLALPNNIGPFT